MSTPPLFRLDPLPDGNVVELRGDEGRHAARVRRLEVGEPVLVGDGRGVVLACSVDAVLADGLRLAVLDRRVEPEPTVRLIVAQALPKGDRAELAVEVLTELGVDEIIPWAASRSIAQWRAERGEKALAKWRRTAQEASKQSRRARVPVIGELANTAALCAGSGPMLVLHESAELGLSAVDLPDAGDLRLVVGPEGGISDAELDQFLAAGARVVRLGTPVLRTSTAGAAALAVLSARLGRWS
jgi:16S rRNA (uracil1498-N3)-methyltransferase